MLSAQPQTETAQVFNAECETDQPYQYIGERDFGDHDAEDFAEFCAQARQSGAFTDAELLRNYRLKKGREQYWAELQLDKD
ncbi:MAG TPA: hypothetical protein VFK06_25280 [Candidatus Angelobacter sp.]|nr:hypothetical protein [Candidatus Angelobacter sp.]